MGLEFPIEAAIFDIGATLVTGPPVAPNKRIAHLLDGVSETAVGELIMTRPFDSAESVRARMHTAALTSVNALWKRRGLINSFITGWAKG